MKSFINLVLQGYAYLYHFVVAAFLLLLSIFAILTKEHKLNLPMFPQTGEALTQALIFIGAVAIITILLAVTRIFVYAFPVYCLVFAVQAFRMLIFPGKAPLDNVNELYWALFFVFGAVGAFFCSLTLLKRRSKKLVEKPA